MLQVNMFRVKQGKEGELREWLLELNTRSAEVKQSFHDESVRGEQGFIVPTSDGPILVYVIEAENIERGRQAYATSTHEIDRQHKEIMSECLGESLHLTPIYDVALP